MAIVKCEIPPLSILDRRTIDGAYFRDSYRAPLSRPDASVVDIFFGVFAHHPLWMKAILIVRNRIASWCGLDAPSASEIMKVENKGRYGVGDTIGVWPIYALSDTELVAGRDNKHLDFRLSVLKLKEGDATSVVVSTICTVHNVFGRIYLFFIVPFHRTGVQSLLANAVAAKRL